MSGRKIQANPRPDGSGYSVSYETGGSRKVHQFVHNKIGESAPHGAGSFHDPNQHLALMDRLEQYLREQGK